MRLNHMIEVMRVFANYKDSDGRYLTTEIFVDSKGIFWIGSRNTPPPSLTSLDKRRVQRLGLEYKEPTDEEPWAAWFFSSV